VRQVYSDSGTNLSTGKYDGFGKAVQTADAFFGFTGRDSDNANGLQYNRQRWYDAKTGAFVSQDPLCFGAGDANTNRYADGDPVNFTDAWGMRSIRGSRSSRPRNNSPRTSTSVSGGSGTYFWSVGQAPAPLLWENVPVTGGASIIPEDGSPWPWPHSNQNPWTILPSSENELPSMEDVFGVHPTGDSLSPGGQGQHGGTIAAGEDTIGDVDQNAIPQEYLKAAQEAANAVNRNTTRRNIGVIARGSGTLAVAAIKGVGTGVVAVVNQAGKAVVSTASLGMVEPGNIIDPSQESIDDGSYGLATIPARLGAELALGIGVGVAGKCGGWAGRIALGWDSAGNVVGAGRGINDILHNGVNWNNGLQTLGGLAGLAGNAMGLRNATSCFVAGTRLVTPEGFKNIEDFVIGDALVTRDENDPEAPVEIGVVLDTFKRYALIWRLVVNGKEILTTAEHPFYVQGQGWKAANELRQGDVLRTLGGRGRVEVSEDTGTSAGVYNLTIAPHHTYFVGGEDWNFALWAHNAGVTGYGAGSQRNPPGTYRPPEALPRNRGGEWSPTSPCPHSQIGTEYGRQVGPYTVGREFGPHGKPIRDIHFTDHGRPNVPGHTIPHQHRRLPNPTGGTPIYGPAEPYPFPH
jgi:RHS repeat-associated protein